MAVPTPVINTPRLMYSLGPGIYILCQFTRPHSEEGKRVYAPVVGQIYPTIGKPRNDFIAFASTAQASPSSVVCLRGQPEQPFASRYNGVDGRHFEISVPSRSNEFNELKYSTHSNDTFVIRRFCDSKCSLFREITNLLDSRV